METSRDSSVWRSLAVTFGGGLALGAVGMKLTQSALRPPEPQAASGMSPWGDRLNRVEQRMDRLEQPHVAPPTMPAPAQQFDQKVLEAVVNAVDARLQDHAGQVERRVAVLESHLNAELQTLHGQNRRVAEEFGQRLAELQTQFRQEVADLRTGMGEELGQFGKAVEARTATLEQSLEARAVTAAAAAAAAQFEEQLVPLRAQVARKEAELTELRERLADSEHAVLDVILAIGQVCRDAAERMAGSSKKPEAAQPPAPPEPVAQSSPEPAGQPTDVVAAEPEPRPEAANGLAVAHPPSAPGLTMAQSLPGFTDPAGGPRLWRVPLVSSFVVMLGGMLLMHYL